MGNGNYLLKHGLIMDGSGKKSYVGDLLVKGKYIAKVSDQEIICDEAEIIDCTGLAISPGWIDCHSHQDHYYPAREPATYFEPFVRQGITSFITGNCGFGAAGFKKGSAYKREILSGFLAAALQDVDLSWDTWPEYYQHVEQKGMLTNMTSLAAHGTALGSILGPGTLGEGAVTPRVEREILTILEDGLVDGGCRGISMGLAYRPGNFTTKEQLIAIAKLAARHNKLLTIHRQVETAVSGYYSDHSKPHNVKWLKELFETLEDTGVGLHISHLIYPGRATWSSYDAMHEMLDKYARKIDITYDMYSYEYGATEIAILLAADLPLHFDRLETDRKFHDEQAANHENKWNYIGMTPGDMYLSNPAHPAFAPYTGMFLDEIARQRGLSNFDNIVDIYKRTRGHAAVILGTYYSPEIILEQMKDEKCLFMTDAWIDPGCAQNPCAYGSFPKFLRLARVKGNLSLEMAVHKMTGKPAGRFALNRRGSLKNGFYADVTIFNPETIAERADAHNPSAAPIGVEKVLINGTMVLDNDTFDRQANSGMVM